MSYRNSWGWIALLGVACAPQATQPVSQNSPAAPVAAVSTERPPLRRGMNLGNALDAPREGDWGVRLTSQHFEEYLKAGFDHVRLPARFNAHAMTEAPYTVEPAFLERVDWAIDQAKARELAVIVDFHHYNELSEVPAQHAERFMAIWEQLAKRYKNQPRSVVLELLNEPHDKLTSEIYNPLIRQALARVRQIDRERLVIIDAVFWAKAEKLAELALPGDDANLIASFHMYEPVLFTHQGLEWMPPEFGTRGIVFPGPPATPVTLAPAARDVAWVADWFAAYNTAPPDQNPCGPKTVQDNFALAADFRTRTGLPLYLGEFGAADSADQASRVRWLKSVREAAEQRQIGWAYWDDGGRFKAFNTSTQQWNPELREALLGG